MTELYIFSQDDQLLTVITESTGLVSAPFREELNTVSDTPFSFTVEADTEQSQHVKEENQVVFRDKDGDLRLYVIKELDDSDGADGPETTAICEPAFMELKEHIVEDRRFTDKEAQVALDAALEGTRWTGEVEVSLGIYSTNFYYITSVDAIWNILETWGGDFKDVVEFVEDSNQIKRRVIKLQQRRGVDRGQRFEIDHNITEIQRTVLSYPITAMYGRGASLETEGGGYTRYIDFADVEWKKANGDPVDKPKGQKWVGDPEALQEYGRVHEGKLLHREGIFSNQDYETAEELLQATWQALQEAKAPEVNYSLSVELLERMAEYEHEHAELGDTSRAIDRNFSRPIEIQARIIAMEYDLTDIEGTATVEMGQFLSVDSDNRLERVIDTINNNRGKWEYVTDKNYPDIVPAVPVNVEASGLFKSILIQWDYTGSVYIKHYEIYGSQVQGFVPQPQHLLYRGNISSFTHAVETDQKWYYRVRAVNHHATASEYSEEVFASTVRVLSDDILFGEDIAAQLRELSLTSQLLADGSINFEQISEAAREQIKQESTTYTDEQITTARNALIQDIADKADLEFVNGKFKFSDEKLQELDGEIVELTNKTITYDQDFVDVKQSVDEVTGTIDTTIRQVEGIDNTVKDHQLKIEQNAKGIESKVSTDTYNQDSDAINRRFESVNSEFSQQAGLIQQRVTEKTYNEGIKTLQTNIDGIQVGGTNLIPGTSSEWESATIGQYNRTASQRYHYSELGLTPGDTITFGVELQDLSGRKRLRARIDFYYNSTGEDGKTIHYGEPIIAKGSKGRTFASAVVDDTKPYIVLFFNNADASTVPEVTDLKYKELMLEKSNKPSAWQPAPEDYLRRFIKNESDIKQYADLISQKVSETVYKTDHDKVVQQLADHTSLIEQTAKKIESKVESSTFNNLQQTVSNQASTIEQQAKLISQKVDSITYNGLKDTVEKHTSLIEQQANQILHRVTTEKLTEEIEKVKVKQYATSGTGSDNYGKWTKIFSIKATARYQFTSLDFSFIAGSDGGSKTRFGRGFARLKQQSAMGEPPIPQLEIRESTGIGAGDFVYVITQNTTSLTEMIVYMRITNSHERYFITPLSSAGNNQPTFYENQGFVKPVPGDYVYAIKNLVAGDTEKVNGVDAGQVTQRLSTAESEIKQQADNIELRVRKDGIVSAINLSSEGVRIDGRLHHITGTTLIDNSVIKSAHIADAAIGNAAIANGVITRAKIGTAAIGTAQLDNVAVTNAKIANLAVDDAKIANISVDKLKAGIINANLVKVQGGSGNEYARIDGAFLSSRGKYTRTWFGENENLDSEITIGGGMVRVTKVNDPRGRRNLYFTNNGISTTAVGADGDEGTGSGVIEFFSHYWDDDRRGLMLYSNLGSIGMRTDSRSIYLDANQDVFIKASIGRVVLQPRDRNRAGNNHFVFNVKDNGSTSDTDGVLQYGSPLTNYASGFRFSKSSLDPTVWVTNGNGDYSSGHLRARSIYATDAIYGDIVGNVKTNTTNLYLMADTEIRFTSKAGYNNGNVSWRKGVMQDLSSNTVASLTIDPLYLGANSEIRATSRGFAASGPIYRDIWAGGFINKSTLDSKQNIEDLENIGLTTVKGLNVVKYNTYSDIERGIYFDKRVGFIAELSPDISNYNAQGIDVYRLSAYNTKAIQELSGLAEQMESNIESIYDILQANIKEIEELKAEVQTLKSA
ncbi:hypothetical protein SAMN05421503_2469 [Terribacillus aidingensis]|uniref:Peptidase S74 domain-containing protein n=1 Tax=Terribacillus aidingensis TaxID=586416 RepID=A0A285NZU7_9BACI|nr:phage tail protein [Terribacillus aidingensis]SNZ14547.1 hypothetical protein SAMN05421503_2469 [Terribacillus aidingensis]